jgi:hypothetical protein
MVYFLITGLFHDPEWGFDASKILKTLCKSFGIFFTSKIFSSKLGKILDVKKSLELSSRDFTVGMTGFEPATPSTPC